MKRKRFPPEDPREWINRAHGNLARSRALSPEFMIEDLCFDSQQAAEKAIKAVYLVHGEKIPFIHDIEDLLRRLELKGLKIPKYVLEGVELTRFAVLTRYPGWLGPVTPREYRRAVRIAAAVLRWAERQVAKAIKPGAKK